MTRTHPYTCGEIGTLKDLSHVALNGTVLRAMSNFVVSC